LLCVMPRLCYDCVVGRETVAETNGEGDSKAAQTLCSTCFEPIDERAKKCIKCDSYQDWRRHLNLSSSVLALLVALVSVLALAVPILKPILETKDSELEVRFQAVANNHVFFLVTNSGNRAGSVAELTLNFSRRETDSNIVAQRVAWRFPIVPAVVAPGESQQVVADLAGQPREIVDRAAYDRWSNNGRPKPRQLDQMYFSVRYRNFRDPSLRDEKFVVGLNRLLMAGPSAWHRCAGSIAWASWNGDPASHFFPSDITPDAVRAFCGPLPGYLSKPADQSSTPLEPDADQEVEGEATNG
jgi:hypothetical protein